MKIIDYFSAVFVETAVNVLAHKKYQIIPKRE